MANELQGKKIAYLISPNGTERVEFTDPKKALEDAGAAVDVISIQSGEARTMDGDVEPSESFPVDKTFSDVSSSEYDGLVIPGGTVGADTLRGDADAVSFIRSFFEQQKPVGAICHAPWTLIEAGVVEGRTLTSYPTLQTDLRNAGATWVDKEVVTDAGLVTSRNPNDIPAFSAKIIEEFAEGKHQEQARSV
ncbi:type 1 glutamine amidotransferase domain-containing protein [Rubrobacter indicoceani]|uniref:type 1 glutamine amidotransferase domain-containing protein n=1 Tax=Rubrobacter indicoceani TaxID=2051957 RepID=UPI000E5BB80B|nr:type 1 glutamine amidotransferase domain-containing protein [Rubrobacter indicoceani]